MYSHEKKSKDLNQELLTDSIMRKILIHLTFKTIDESLNTCYNRRPALNIQMLGFPGSRWKGTDRVEHDMMELPFLVRLSDLSAQRRWLLYKAQTICLLASQTAVNARNLGLTASL